MPSGRLPAMFINIANPADIISPSFTAKSNMIIFKPTKTLAESNLTLIIEVLPAE